MEELLKNPDVQSKIKKLSPHVRRAFVESLLDLFEQETEDMIDAIEESRMELRGTMLDFEDETEQLRAESRMLEQRRLDNDKNSVNKYLEEKGRKSRSSRNSSRISYIDERSEENKTCVKDYMRRKEQSRLMFNEERSLSSLSVPSLAPVERPISAQTTRSLPTPSPRMSRKALQEETDAIMQNLTTADQQLATERYRQTELIEERRTRKKEQLHKSREEQAIELLEKALMMDKQLNDKKTAQEKRLKERLEEMKRKKDRSSASAEPMDRIDDLERF